MEENLVYGTASEINTEGQAEGSPWLIYAADNVVGANPSQVLGPHAGWSYQRCFYCIPSRTPREGKFNYQKALAAWNAANTGAGPISSNFSMRASSKIALSANTAAIEMDNPNAQIGGADGSGDVLGSNDGAGSATLPDSGDVNGGTDVPISGGVNSGTDVPISANSNGSVDVPTSVNTDDGNNVPTSGGTDVPTSSNTNSNAIALDNNNAPPGNAADNSEWGPEIPESSVVEKERVEEGDIAPLFEANGV
jgi:hypothetical protein